MNFLQLNSSLKKEIKPCYFLSGTDPFIINSAIRSISKAVVSQFEEMNVTVFDADNFTYQSFYEACEQFPFCSEKKVVILKSDVKLSESDKKKVIANLRNLPSTLCLVVVQSESLQLLKDVEVVDCKNIDFDVIQKYIATELKKMGKGITQSAASKLFEFTNGNMSAISNEVVKVANYANGDVVENADITASVIPSEEYLIFDLTDAISNGNTNKALKILDNFITKKEPIQNIFSLISKNFRRVAYCGLCQLSNYELAQIFGVKEYAIVKAKQQSEKYPKIHLRKILQMLEDCDYSVKSGQMQAENAIYLLIIQIMLLKK